MNSDKNAFKAGLFIVFALLLAAGVLVAIQGARSWLEPSRTVTVAFDLTENLGGLKSGDPVRIGGLDQGHVHAVRYVASSDAVKKPHSEVDFTIPKRFDLRSDAVVSVEQALTGAANLNITDLGRAAPFDGKAALDGRPSAIGTLYAIAPELQALVSDVRSKVQPAYQRYDQTLAKAEETVVEGKKAFATFSDFLGGSGPDLRGTLANLNKTTNTVNDRLPKTLDKADAFIDETKQAVVDGRAAIKDARALIAKASDTVNDTHALITRNRSRIDNILTSVRETAGNLEGASAEIRRSPWRLLYQPTKDEMNNLALYDATRQFARAAGQLNDAAGAVRDAAGDPTVDRKQIQSLLDDLTQTFAKYREVEQVLWKQVK